jgi:hypothetical protein
MPNIGSGLIGVGVDGGQLVHAKGVQIGGRERGGFGQLALDAGAELLRVGRVIAGRDLQWCWSGAGALDPQRQLASVGAAQIG